MTAIIDPRIPTGRIVIREVPLPAWKCTRVDYDDETQAGGNHNMYVTCLDGHGAPMSGVGVTYGFPNPDHPDDTATQYTDARGVTDFGMYGPGGMCPRDPHTPGPYFIRPFAGDTVWGMCLPGDHHVNYRLTYVWTEEEPEPPEPPTPPPIGVWTTVYRDENTWLQVRK